MLPQTVFEAKLLVAQKILEGKDLPRRSRSDKQRRTKSRHQGQLEGLCLKLYSLPWIRPAMHSWMVDVKFGNSNTFGKRQKSTASPILTDLDPESLEPITTEMITRVLEQTNGSLVTQAERYLNTLDVRITDRAGGNGGGHLGCWCNDQQRDDVIQGVLKKFHKAIEADLISVGIVWFKPRFNGLRTTEDAQQFLPQ